MKNEDRIIIYYMPIIIFILSIIILENINSIVDYSILDDLTSIFLSIITLFITSFTIILAISDRPIIKCIFNNNEAWKQLCDVGFLPVIFSIVGLFLQILIMLINNLEFIIVKNLILSCLITSIVYLFLFVFLLWNILKKSNKEKNKKESDNIK